MIRATVAIEGNEGIYDVICSERRPREIFLYYVWDFEFNNINFANHENSKYITLPDDNFFFFVFNS